VEGKYTGDFKHTENRSGTESWSSKHCRRIGEWLGKYHYMLILLLDTSLRIFCLPLSETGLTIWTSHLVQHSHSYGLIVLINYYGTYRYRFALTQIL